jgi:hypothetical protein
MANDWSIIIGGRAFPFEGYGATVTGMSGVGMAPITNVLTTYASSPGASYQRAKVKPRELIIQAALKGTSVANIHHLRSHLIDAVRSDRTVTEQPVTLRYTGGSVPVEIDGYYDAGLEFTNPTGYVENLAMRFVCPDPFFRGTADVHGGTMSTTTQSFMGIANQVNGVWDVRAGVSDVFGVSVFNDEIFYSGNGFVYGGAYIDRFESSVVKWNGDSWIPYMGTTELGSFQWSEFTIRAMCMHHGTLWACVESFPYGTTIPKLRRIFHNGGAQNSSWSMVGTLTIPSYTAQNINKSVSLKSSGGDLYLFGDHMRFNNGSMSPLLRYAQGDFTPVPAPVSYGTIVINGTPEPINGRPIIVDVIKTSNTTMYIAPAHGVPITTTSGTITSILLRYTPSGTTNIVESMGTGDLSNVIYSMCETEYGNIIAGGYLSSVNDIPLSNIAMLSDTYWRSAGSFHPIVSTVVYDDVNKRVHASFYRNPITYISQDAEFMYRENWYNNGLTISEGNINTSVVFKKSTGDIVVVKYTGTGGSITLPLAGSAIVTGGAKVSPVITIRNGGAVTQISNVTTGDMLFLDNLTMTDTETITLDFAKRTYTSDQRGNLLSYIRHGSNVANWSLVPGTNIINVSAGDSASIDVTWRDKYWSLDT